MSYARITNPTGTVTLCPDGCDVPTVEVDLGDGRTCRVHCGTYRPACPTRPAAR
ncbi:hypothetical protein GCM10022243_43330 [Saccharothrix violaceirubra]|uniref:Uncharacterized protein n=1 Tax=Saccharothrix violaceirubra TaxID=413306 RepID=A0A7W7T3J1_9PSEU|nr:hypothetical protein [Saccharothrix violaceirubra]MBB4965621.1 hypothetical protein [Saccharothrix violaceirubra]